MHYINVIFYRAQAEMRAEVARGALGMLLWVLEPVIYMGAFYLIFSLLNIRGGVEAIPYLLPALVVWKWFASSVYRGAVSIAQGAAVMQQIYVPKYVFLASVLLSAFYQFMIVFFILVVFLIFYGISPVAVWFNLIPLIFIQFILIVAVAGFFAVLLPFLPDLKIVISNGLTLMFFLSGVFFDVSAASEMHQRILYLNPMASVIEGYRDIFLNNAMPDWGALANVFVFSLILLMMVIFLIKKWDRIFPKVLPL